MTRTKARTQTPKVYVDADPAIPDHGTQYLQCGLCLDEWTESFQGTCSPRDYCRQQCALTRDGLQVRCTRHGVNVATFSWKEAKE